MVPNRRCEQELTRTLLEHSRCIQVLGRRDTGLPPALVLVSGEDEGNVEAFLRFFTRPSLKPYGTKRQHRLFLTWLTHRHGLSSLMPLLDAKAGPNHNVHMRFAVI